MFNNAPHADKLNDAIEDLLNVLKSEENNSPLYATTLEQLKELYALRDLNQSKAIDPNTLITVAGNFGAILLIVKYEQLNIITTKALSFVKLK